jgi:hypothetical protein
MSSNNRTPQSVLNAPDLPMPIVVSAQPGQNRAGRRHVFLDSHGHQSPMAASITIPRAARKPATNIPYEDQVKSWHRRGKKARRHALRTA